jgi:putative flippase GtrA
MSAAVPRLPATFVRFAAIGVANTAIDVVLFWMLYGSLGIFAANVVSTSAGMAFSFWMNGRHTFGAGRATPGQAVRFVATNAVTMWLLQPLAITAALGVPLVSLPVAKLAGLAVSVVANFLLYRYVVWGRATGEVAVSSEQPPAGRVAAREAARR